RLVDLLAEPAQAGERLAALEKVAELERGPGARRAALGEAARLAAGLGDAERASGYCKKRLSLDPTDREALDALVDLAAGAPAPNCWWRRCGRAPARASPRPSGGPTWSASP